MSKKNEFIVEDYMILKQNPFRGKVTYIVELTLKDGSNVVRGDEVRNIAGEMWVATTVTPEKLTIIGESMDHLLSMTGLWGIGHHFKLES